MSKLLKGNNRTSRGGGGSGCLRRIFSIPNTNTYKNKMYLTGEKLKLR